MDAAIGAIVSGCSPRRPAKASFIGEGCGFVATKTAACSGRAVPEEGGDEQARNGNVIAPALLGQAARVPRQAADLVAGIERDGAQRGFGAAVVFAAEDLEGTVRVP